jgi:putative glutamine amidotransferase
MAIRICVPARLSAPGRAHRLEAAWGGSRYLQALRRAGAFGLVVPPWETTRSDLESIFDDFDGLLLMGGLDADAALYGQPAHEANDAPSALEDSFELMALSIALERNLPVLAICRGMQLLNIHQGGSLRQHISDDGSDIKHAMDGFPSPAPGAIGELHAVTLGAHSKTATALGDVEVVGASSHHQAIDRIGSDLNVVGHADDGIIEAIEMTEGWVVAVQWHPEDTAAVDAQQQSLFNAFVAQCDQVK